jgi:hypothetical protein
MSNLHIVLGSAQSKDPFAVQAATLSRLVRPDDSHLASLTVTALGRELATVFSPMDLASYDLAKHATVRICILGNGDDDSNTAQVVHTAFLLAGIMGATETKGDGERVISGMKQGAMTTSAPLVVAIEDDMVDEDELLLDSNNLLAPPPAMSAALKPTAGDDCGGRKPCDDCTCGRAEAEKTNQPQVVQSSSCGKCGMGDAFRCASCPYLGKPAFKAGEEHLVLDLQDDL